MCFTCVLIKEEAEGAGPQSHHQNGSSVRSNDIVSCLIMRTSVPLKTEDAPLPRFAATTKFDAWERKFKAFLRTKTLLHFYSKAFWVYSKGFWMLFEGLLDRFAGALRAPFFVKTIRLFYLSSSDDVWSDEAA